MLRTIEESARWRGQFTELRGLQIKPKRELVLEPVVSKESPSETPSAIQLVSGSSFVLEAGARLVIRRGGSLVVRTGTRMHLAAGAQILVEPGGYVYIEHKADISVADETSGFVLDEGAKIGMDPSFERSLPKLKVAQPIPRVQAK